MESSGRAIPKHCLRFLRNSLPAATGSAGTTLTLFDLRKLRFRGIEMSRDWERIAYGFDLMVLIPELTPDEMIQ